MDVGDHYEHGLTNMEIKKKQDKGREREKKQIREKAKKGSEEKNNVLLNIIKRKHIVIRKL